MAAVQVHKQFTGVVVSAGKMSKCVKVQLPKQKWNKRIQKYFSTPYNILVSDPNSSVREGDIVTVRALGQRTSARVKHVVTNIVAPMGPPLSQRPPLPTEAEFWAAKEVERAAKDLRQAANGRWVAAHRVRLRELGLTEEEWQAQQDASKALAPSKKEIVALQAKAEALVEERRKRQEAGIRPDYEGPEYNVGTDEEVLSLDQLLQNARRTRQSARSKGFEMEDQLEALKANSSLSEYEKEAEAAELRLAIENNDRKIRQVEAKEYRLDTYLGKISGKEAEYATSAIRWNILTQELEFTNRERMAAVAALASLDGIPHFGQHIRRWSPEGVEAWRVKSLAKKEGQTSTTKLSVSQERFVAQSAEAPDTVQADASLADERAPESAPKKTQQKKGRKIATQEKKPRKKGVMGWLGL